MILNFKIKSKHNSIWGELPYIEREIHVNNIFIVRDGGSVDKDNYRNKWLFWKQFLLERNEECQAAKDKDNIDMFNKLLNEIKNNSLY